MTFRQFEELFKAKHPEGTVVQHGKFGGTEKNNKVAVTFGKDSKVYEYYGSYQNILGKVGIKVAYKSDIEALERRLAELEASNGQNDEFFGFTIDNSEAIEETKRRLNDIKDGILID